MPSWLSDSILNTPLDSVYCFTCFTVSAATHLGHGLVGVYASLSEITFYKNTTQPGFIFSKLTIETLEQGGKYVQS